MPHRPLAEPDKLPFGLLAAGVDGRVLRANAWLAAALGQPQQALVGHRVDSLLGAAGRVLFHTYLMPLLRLHGQVQEFALPLQRADGQDIEVLVFATWDETDADGARVHLAMVPMRERRRIEAELLRVQRAADATPGLLFECVVQQGRARLAYASEGIRALYGLRPQAVHGSVRPVLRRVHPQDRRALLTTARSAAGGQAQWACDFRARNGPGAEWRWHALQASCRALPGGGVAWHGFVNDVTQRHTLEALQRERDAADRASRAKSEFLARMSHELRTPLNGIIGFAHMLGHAQQPLDAAELRRRAGIIEASGRQLLTLINDVLDISRIETGHLQVGSGVVPLRAAVEQAAATLEPMAAAVGVRIDLACPAGVRVLADAGRLAQALTNLLSNAIKYNRRGGRVEVTLDDASSAEPGVVRLTVADTGAGLSPAQTAALFQPFNRLGAEQSRIEGTGLGLVITRELVQLMGGSIEVQSTPGVGSRFTVQLRRATAPQAAVLPPEGPLHAVAGEPAGATRCSVLYVEDNPVNAMLMEVMLEDLATIHLRTAGDGAAALASAAREPPALVLLDLHLPDTDGLALLARLRALPGMAAVPAVAVSADAMPEHIARATAAGFCAYWTKPLDVAQVRREVPRLALGAANVRAAAGPGITAPS